MTINELNRINDTGNTCPRRKAKFFSPKEYERAKRVLVDGEKQCDIAKEQGVSRGLISQAVRKAYRGAWKINGFVDFCSGQGG